MTLNRSYIKSLISHNKKKSSFLFVTFTISILVMTIFEATKKPLLGDLTLWQSHTVTIVFSSLLATLFASFTFDVIRDLERKHAEEDFRVDKEKLDSVFELSPLGMLRNSMDGYYMEANQAFLNIVGYSLEELRALNYWDLIPKKYTVQEEAQLNSLRSTGKYDPYEKEYIHRDGHLVPIRLSGVLLTDKDGTESIWSIVEDITAARLYADSSQIATMVYQHTSEAIMVTDSQGTIVNINPAFTQITGYTEEEVIGASSTTLSTSQPDNAAFLAMMEVLENVGHWQGEMVERHKNGDVYIEWLTINTIYNADRSVHFRVSIFTDITQKKSSEALILRQANFDSLTGLPNRALLQDRLKQAIVTSNRHQKLLALLFLDLDNFKTINDSLGHDVGDLLLQAVAERLQRSIREEDTVSRLGGDEFVVVLLDIQKADNAANIAQKIVDELANPFNIGDHILYVTSSIGISLYPEDGYNSDILIKNADSAMYSAKTGGRNCYRFFTQDMNEQALARLTLESDLRQALSRGEFRLHYQPQISSKTGTIIGMEALIRWQHPIRGIVPPANFVPLAEDIGLIASIGEWVLREACRQNRAWQAQGLPPVTVAVNLSALQFLQHNLPDKIQEILDETGLEPRYLELELTESTFMQDAEHTIATLHTLKAMGLQLAIDDFGTGYSSLSYLKRFPIDKLKIDQSFVRELASDPDDAAIARTIIRMGHSLRLEVIAEGVETVEQLAFMKKEGCDQIQGYFFSKPLTPDELGQFMLQNEMTS